MAEKSTHMIRIHPVGTKVTDEEQARRLAVMFPASFRKAQDVLVAARKYINKSGLFSTEKSRLQQLQSECYELVWAMESDGYLSDKRTQEHKAFAFIEFFGLFSDAFPNWQKEYEALNRFVPLIF